MLFLIKSLRFWQQLCLPLRYDLLYPIVDFPRSKHLEFPVLPPWKYRLQYFLLRCQSDIRMSLIHQQPEGQSRYARHTLFPSCPFLTVLYIP